LFLTIKDNIPYKPLPKNCDTAELISIMLGDGHLHPIEKDKVVQISLNLVDEEHYFEYVGKLLKKIFPHSEFRMKENQGKGVDWITTNSRIHFAICELGRGLNKTGLIPGNKVENQVSEPEWVLSSNIFIKKGLKGLFDTDGSIGVSRKSQFILTFSNSSKNLVNDFYFMCKKIGLDKIGNIVDIGHNTWRVPIYDSEEIKKFLNIVKPEKFQEPYRRLWLGLNIIYRRAPKSIRIKIEEYLNEWRKTVGFNRKYFSYTKENTELLKEWIEILFRESCLNYVFGYKFDYYISNEMIESALRTGLLSQYECISYSLDCNNRYRVHWFPEKLRNNIIDCITKYLKYSTDQIIFFVFEQLISNSQWMAILNPFNESEYNDTLKNYLESMILVIKEIDRYKTKNGNYHSLGHYTLETYFKNKGINLAFSRKVIKKILDYFKAQIYE